MIKPNTLSNNFTFNSTPHKLVIAEKPSVAISIAKVIGANNKKDGYYEGNDYKVSWCVGHLIQMANPDAYDEKYAKWNMADLPIIPSEYKYDVTKATKKQFAILKKLMNDKEIDTVINACDAGREGESIFRLVYNEAKCKKKMQRLWISSMEDSAIKEGFDNLKDGKDYDNLFESAQARAIADWLVGMNISRLYSCLYKQNYSVGRVQTPTLAMIVKRDDEIANFKKEKYYTVELYTNGFTLSTDRIDDEVAAEQLINLVGDKIEITDVIQKEKITKPDLPFDLTTLQRECNKYFGYSAKQTLDYAQSLYEKKLITYPRTDSRCLTEDMITSTINNILGKNDFDTGRIKTVFNSKKVTDHHAIIPTISSLKEDVSELPLSEAKVYFLISDKFHASVGYPLIENATKIVAEFDGFEFTSTGKAIKDEGFIKYLKEYKAKKDENTELPDVSIGDVERKKELTNMDYEYKIVSSENRKNPTWTNGTVTDMLSNENYTGTYVFNMQEKSVLTPRSFKFHPKEEWGRVYNHHEAIISQEEFDKVQAIKESRRFIKGKNTDYPWRQHSPLQGFAKCPTCNHILGFIQSKRPRLDGSVRVHRYFHCRICKCNNVEHKNSRAEKLEEQVLALIKEKYGEVKPEQKDKISVRGLEKQVARLEAKKTSDFEKYKLGKMTKLKFIESKKSIDKDLESLSERIDELSKQDEVVKDNELTRELMEKYIDSVLCEGSIVQKIIWK